MYHEPFVRIVR